MTGVPLPIGTYAYPDPSVSSRLDRCIGVGERRSEDTRLGTGRSGERCLQCLVGGAIGLPYTSASD